MAKNRKMSRRYSDEEQQSIINDYLKSGLTVKDYCKNVEVSEGSLGRWLRKARQQPVLKKKHYTPLQRKEAVEEFMKSGMNQYNFSKIWGIDQKTLSAWYKVYREKGPKALVEGEIYGKGKKKGRPSVKLQVRKKILEAKKNLPEHGIKKLRDFLGRFEGIKVAPNTIKKVLVEEEVYEPPPAPPKKKAPPKIRRFERANPMQMWQSDITSFVLKRTGQRVYLVVFKDDHSRYIVSWALALKQTGSFVIECFLDGTQKFGKPEEVLTDQGRQYFSWRGKSEFQKMLENEGIKHVVSRSHHPQTLGKCERFWKTVGTEFWNRAKPLELAEARERFSHYVNHFNHFRPHQGIDGATPADKFFGVHHEIREAIEDTLSKNELRLSIDQSPRKPFYFVGQVGNQRVAMVGTKGKLEVKTPDGNIERLDYEDFGNRSGEFIGKAGDHSGQYCEENEKAREKEGQLQDASASSDSSERPVGSCEPGRSEESSQESDNDHGILDGDNLESGSGRETRSSSPSDMANESTGDLGDVCRTAQAAQEESGDEQRRRSDLSEEEDRGTREDDRSTRAPDRHFKIDARLQGSDIRIRAQKREGEEEAREKGFEESQEDRSETWKATKEESDTRENSNEWWRRFSSKRDKEE